MMILLLLTFDILQIEPLTLKGILNPVVCYEFKGTTPPVSEHDHLDSGTIVIEKYLKKCMTDIFDSHKFLNGSVLGLEVQVKRTNNKNTHDDKEMISKRKRRKSTEAVSLLSTRREYRVSNAPIPALNNKMECIPDGKASSNRELMEFNSNWNGFFVVKGASGSGT